MSAGITYQRKMTTRSLFSRAGERTCDQGIKWINTIKQSETDVNLIFIIKMKNMFSVLLGESHFVSLNILFKRLELYTILQYLEYKTYQILIYQNLCVLLHLHHQIGKEQIEILLIILIFNCMRNLNLETEPIQLQWAHPKK